MYKHLLFFFLISLNINAQKERTIFFGKISDNIGVLENVHIINLQTNKATHTSPFGKFKIFAKAKDSLKITSVGYHSKILVLKTTDFGITEKQIILKKEIIELDEVEIKKHNLIGSLESDIKQVPKDRVKEIVDNAMTSIMNIKLGPVIEKIDEIDRMKAPIVNTDPIGQGATFLSFSIGGNKITKYNRKKELDKKQQLPNKIIELIGRKTLINEFKIPEDKIFHFLDYCSYNKELEDLVFKEKTLKLIEILENESLSYLKIIKEDK